MKIELEQFLREFEPKICSFAYNLADGSPAVCQMGFVTYENKIILHTNTWTKKWQAVQNGQEVALCIGFTHLESYIQVQGTASKVMITDDNFTILESVYFDEHTDAVNYKSHGREGIILITPTKLRYAKVEGYKVRFDDYILEEGSL